MSNQWGRNNQIERTGGSPGLLLPAVLCIALIGAGGYFWFARQQMQTEIAALNAQTAALSGNLARVTAEKDKASRDLTEFKKNSGNWAEELEKEYADLKLNQVPKLNRLLDKRDANISALENMVSSEKAGAKSAAEDFTATIARINEELTATKADAANARSRAQNMGAEKIALEKQISGLKAALEQAAADTAAARKDLEQRAAEAEKERPSSKTALDQARDVEISNLKQSLDEERRKVGVLEKQLKDQAEAALNALVTSEPARPATNDAASNGTQAPRDHLLVENILGATRGVRALGDEKTQQLKDQLVSGACVTDALESVFDKVPLVLMRNLMRDFKSDC